MTQLPALADPPLRTRAIDLMLVALAIALLPHLSHLPVIVTSLCLAFGTWRWLAAHRDWPLPGMPTRTLLTLLSLAIVFLHFGTVFGRDAGAALLAVMLGLKLLEVRSYRDAIVVVFLGYFLTVIMVLFNQDILIIATLAAALLLITMSLVELNHSTGDGRPLHGIAGYSGRLLLQAVPLMLILFLLFPRIPGPLWSLPDDAHGATTGLSDTMSPGSISDLGQSDEVAFRVRFDEAIPSPDMLYWRGPVFWHTDGREWSIGASRRLPDRIEEPAFTPLGEALHYEVTLEPHNRRWLFALEMPARIPDDSHHTRDLLVLAERPVRQLRRYHVASHGGYRAASPLTAAERARALQLPEANPRARRLGREWRDDLGSDRDVIRHALDHFRNEPFHYTLQPPLLGRQPIDEFLFDTRRGFCEHYAAAFTVLMRAAGIPTRVVTGYQGGELNPLGDYLIVRQRDAHAWAEVWLDGDGWVRIDPTAAVAPERIDRGSFESLTTARERGFEQGLFGTVLRQAGFGWDALNNRWNQWVLGYGPERQLALLSRIGIANRSQMALLMIAATGACLAAIAMMLLLRRRTGDSDVAVLLYQRFCDRLARRGIVREAAEGPVEFAGRARARRPDQAAAIDAIIRRYIAIRYGGNHTPDQVRWLRRDVARFRP